MEVALPKLLEAEIKKTPVSSGYGSLMVSVCCCPSTAIWKSLLDSISIPLSRVKNRLIYRWKHVSQTLRFLNTFLRDTIGQLESDCL